MINGFCANMALRGLATATIERRRWTLTAIEQEANRRLVTLSTMDIETFLARRSAPATRRALLGDLRAFYRWARSRKLAVYDPTAPIEPPKIPRRLPTPLTRDEVQRAWSAAGFNLRVMIALGASAGLRVSEIAALHTDDIDLENGVLVVRQGKGGKDRAVPIAPALAELLRHVPAGPVTSQTTGDAVSKVIRRHLRECGIQKRAHDLRASFATEAARVSGGNLVLVARLMGHDSMATTTRYVGEIDGSRDVIAALWAA